MPIDLVLVHPEIPQNTGNVARTCAALGATLHLIHPLGFAVDERSVRRAGLDYWELLEVREYPSLDDFLERTRGRPLVLCSSFGGVVYTEIDYGREPMLLFGSETAGLPDWLLQSGVGPIARIPTVAEARCLNLSNAVAVVAYEAARQSGFRGLQLRRARDATDRTSRASE